MSYNTNSTHSPASRHPNLFSILHHNTAGSNKIFIALQSAIRKDPPHILCIQEPYLYKGLPRPATGYHLIHPPIDPLHRILSCIYIRIDYAQSAPFIPLFYDRTDLCGLLITHTVKGTSTPITVLSAYNRRIPTTPYRSINPSTLFKNYNGPCFITGDFNIHHPLADPLRTLANSEINTALPYFAKAHDEDFTLLNSPGSYTRYPSNPNNRPSVIDLAWANNHAMNLNPVWVNHLPHSGSDHTVCMIKCTDLQTDPPNPVPNWGKTDWLSLAPILKAVELPEPPALASAGDVELWFDSHLDKITALLKTHTPNKSSSIRSKAWWTPEISSLRRIYHSVARSRHLGDASYREWKLSRNAYFNAIQKAKKAHWNSFIENASPTEVWKTRRAVLPPTSDKIPSFPHASTPLEVNQAMIHHFFPPKPTPPPPSIRIHPEAPPITRDEVSEALAVTSNSSAPGPDSIPYGVWKKVNNANPSILTDLLTPLAIRGFHPRSLKKANGIVLPKPNKPNYADPSSFRIIVLLQTVSKILERIMAVRLHSIAIQNGLLHPHQCGSLKGLSCADAVTTLTHETKLLQQSNLEASSLFLDIKGGFDNVQTATLKTTLLSRGTLPYVCEWVSSFLSHRQCRLIYKGSPHKLLPVDVGVPQGSPISPLLFCIYVAPLHEDPKVGIMLSYVDDFAITVASTSHAKNIHLLTKAFNSISAKGTTRGVSFSVPKTELIHWTSQKHNSSPSSLPITVAGQTFKPLKEVRWVGYWLTPSNNTSAHYLKRLAAAQRAFGILKRLASPGKGLHPANCRKLAIGVILPILTYGAAVFTPLTNICNKLQVFWNSILRWITNCFRSTPSTILWREAHSMPISLYIQRTRQTHTARLLNADPARNPATARMPSSIPLRSGFRAVSHRHLLPKHNKPQPWNSQAKAGVPSLPIDKLIREVRSLLPNDINQYPLLKIAIYNASIFQWEEKFPTPSYYHFPATPWPDHFMALDRFTAGRIHQMRAQKSYLKAHKSWMNPDDSSICPRCETEDDTLDHALTSCPAFVTQQIQFLHKIPSIDDIWGSKEHTTSLAQFIKAVKLGYPPAMLRASSPTPSSSLTSLSSQN